MKTIRLALSGVAGWFAGAFLLIGFLVFIKTTVKQERTLPVEPVMGAPVRDGFDSQQAHACAFPAVVDELGLLAAFPT